MTFNVYRVIELFNISTMITSTCSSLNDAYITQVGMKGKEIRRLHWRFLSEWRQPTVTSCSMLTYWLLFVYILRIMSFHFFLFFDKKVHLLGRVVIVPEFCVETCVESFDEVWRSSFRSHSFHRKKFLLLSKIIISTSNYKRNAKDTLDINRTPWANHSKKNIH